jgi:hypothetical protein
MGCPGYPQPQGYPGGGRLAVLRDGQVLPQTARVDPVEGTPYGVAFMRAPATVSGAAIGSMLAGIAAVFVGFVTGCFGLGTAAGVVAGGAFAILATVAGFGGVGLGVVGIRQVSRGGGRVTGRGMAIAGLACGGCGIVITAVVMLGAALSGSGGAA